MRIAKRMAIVYKKAVKMKEVFARIKDQIHWNHHIYMLIESSTILSDTESSVKEIVAWKMVSVAKMFKTKLRKKGYLKSHVTNESVGWARFY